MALESGDYIADLDVANPVTATDPVTQGADHLRLLKRALRNSFPAFVGTQAAPKTVTLSEDQINDAALKSDSNTFGEVQNFSAEIRANAGIRLANNQAFRGLDSGASSRILLNVQTDDNLRFGDTALLTNFYFSGIGGHYWYHNGSGSAQRCMESRAPADGSLVINDGAGAFGAVAAVHKSQTFSERQTFSNGAEISSFGVRLANTIPLFSRNAGDSANVVIASVDASDRPTFGESGSDSIYQSARHRFFIGGEELAQGVSRDSGSLLVFNSRGEAKKAGFRNPRLTQISGNGSAVQNWEGEIIEATGAIAITLVALEATTTFRIINVGDDPITITGVGVAIERFLGGSSEIGTFTLAPKSVIECWYRTGTSIRVFGNGTS